MNLLAIETSTEACSAAVLTDAGLVARSEIAPRLHAQRVLPMCGEALAEAGIARSALDAIAVGRGPGAFTGVRLAIAAAQGIALALDIPVVPVSSLAALALAAPDNGAPILAVIDARMGELYAGTFVHAADGLVKPLGPERVYGADQLELEPGHEWNVIGSGWLAHADAIRARLPRAPVWAEGAQYPQAAAVARLAVGPARCGEGVAAEHALPVYLRDKVALTSAEQRARR
jgi:tRNA threonylcarbamoyladenosine biosynthesis protein TsaB